MTRQIDSADIREVLFHIHENDDEAAIEYLLFTYEDMTRDEAVDIVEYYKG